PQPALLGLRRPHFLHTLRRRASGTRNPDNPKPEESRRRNRFISKEINDNKPRNDCTRQDQRYDAAAEPIEDAYAPRLLHLSGSVLQSGSLFSYFLRHPSFAEVNKN